MKRLQILQKVGDRLKTITIANGYKTDIGGKVYYFKVTPFEYATGGGVTYADRYELVREVNQKHERDLKVEIEGVMFGDDALVNSNNILADLTEAIGRDRTWDKLALKSTIDPDEGIIVTVEEAGKRVVRVTVNLLIVYRTEIWKNE